VEYFFTSKYFSIRWYSILIMLGIFLAIIFTINEARKFNLSKDFIINIAFWIIVGGIICARIYYVIFSWNEYKSNPIDIFKIWEGGLAIHGGLLGGFLMMWLYCKKYKVRLIRFLDIICPYVLLAQAIGRWGNFFNQEAYGVETTYQALKKLHIPDFVIGGMRIDGIIRTPTFYYESLWCLLGFIVLMVIRHLKYTKVGTQTSIYLMWYSIGRFYIESLRTDSLMFGNYRVAQIVSIILFIIGFMKILIDFRKSKLDDLYYEDGAYMMPNQF
jgi:phosphatidylglycerol---prolipoprotein diacylglyceryl transferase